MTTKRTFRNPKIFLAYARERAHIFVQVDTKRLKDFILDAGLVTRKDIDAAIKTAEEKHTTLGEILVSEGRISEDDLRRVQAYMLGIPFLHLKGQKIDIEILTLIPEPVARSHNIVPVRKIGNALEVAMLDTADLEAIEFVKKKVGLKVLPRLTDTESMKDVLLQYQKSLRAEFGDIIQKAAGAIKDISVVEGEEAATGDLHKLAEDLPVIRIVDTLLKHAIIQNASDIHIEPMDNQLLVRYRIDGILRDAMVLPTSASASITARIKVLSKLKLDEKRLPQDGRFKVDVDNEKVSFRVSVLPTYFGEKTVMRLLREGATGFTLEVLGYHGYALEAIHKALSQTTGMILTTGPTGSGKTTSLYTMLDILNTPEVNISTIEDPIEYQMNRVNQTQVRPDIDFTFSKGLRALVRQDPDIIMVGEIRDNETASLAINASLTGHLVLSTLHTNSAAGAIPRLLDMKVEPFLMVSTLYLVIAQRLVRQLTKEKEKYTLSKDELTALEKRVDLEHVLAALKEEHIVEKAATWAKIPFYKPKTADTDEGFSGRIGIYETIPITSTIKELIMRGATAEAINEQARKEGMLTMLEDGIFKAVEGQTTIEEVLRVISE
ncbi:MAG: putative type II secretion system protein E [Parcubacteria group bacterium Gr01-1014_48]|nr:MAG: putative type II secretion system protein E [Parcubacteria group bacterium Greene0416_14]TSC73820.1 MAG: putative type II secretion system protein E [Parcubacteria group bacterium Gr01-1014_48]TSD01201.1 MAG: putative type II secretion system protein E [Parcubacteria group bacterium Greene1014_15]TSD08042.1 MAG: putative type II secretion system protein E [Parcubacteria group bacterium Greene0714_4]